MAGGDLTELTTTIARVDTKMDGLDAKMTDFIDVQRKCNKAMQADIKRLDKEQVAQSERIGTLGKVFGGIQAVITTVFGAAVAALWGRRG